MELPVVIGSEGERALDISALRSSTGHITLDPGFANTGSCTSSICYIDGEKGILRYRGIPIEQLARKSSFLETAWLLIYGDLPTKGQLETFIARIKENSLIHEDMKRFFEGFPRDAHPMSILASAVAALHSFYQHWEDPKDLREQDLGIIRLLAKVPTIAAFAYKKAIGEPFIYPDNRLSYAANYLNMMFTTPAKEYLLDEDVSRALDLLLLLHADHEQNCSTSTVRLVGSSLTNLYASIAAGICALWGPLHGGANQKVIEMLQHIVKEGGDVKRYVELAKKKDSRVRLMGFGHRVYKNFDPRAAIVKETCHRVLKKLPLTDPLLETAQHLEQVALSDEYFIERKLYPNVDFYSGIIYAAMGIPANSFTELFALGRVPGWIANWREMMNDPESRLGRPRQIYTGETERDYVPIDERG